MSRKRVRSQRPILRLVSRCDHVAQRYAGRSPPPYLRLVFSAGETGGDAVRELLPHGWGAAAINDLMGKMIASANAVADRATDAMRGEVTAFGLELDADTLAAIRQPVFNSVVAGIRARILRGARGSDFHPDEDVLIGEADDDLHPYIEHTGMGLRERLRSVLESGEEPA